MSREGFFFKSKTDRQDMQSRRKMRDADALLRRIVEEFSLEEFSLDELLDSFCDLTEEKRRPGGPNRKLLFQSALDNLCEMGFVEEDRGTFVATEIGFNYIDALD